MLEEDDIESPEVKHSPVRKNTVPVSETTPVARNKVCPEGNEEDNSSTSDKKDDWVKEFSSWILQDFFSQAIHKHNYIK